MLGVVILDFMEKLDKDKEFSPWNSSFEYRLKELMYYKNEKFNVAVYLYEKADTSTFRYRAYNMCQALSESVEWRGIYFFENELVHLRDYIKYIDIVVLVRFHWCPELARFVSVAKQQGKTILFDIDDLVFETKYLYELLDSININRNSVEEVRYWGQYVETLNHTALMCDSYITTNDYLKEFIGGAFGKSCVVIPNTFNVWQETVSDNCAISKEKDGFTIGYFSGSHTHEKDFQVMAKAIRELLYSFPEMKLVIGGHMKVPGYMEELVKLKKIEFLPFMNFTKLQCEIAKVNVNVVPLTNTIFTNCKSELKYFEASLVRTLSVMSPRYVYQNIIKTGENGYLCNDNGWCETIFNIYNHWNDQSKIIENAYAFCKKEYRYSSIRCKIEECFEKYIG